MKVWREGKNIRADRELPPEEQELLESLLIWSHVDKGDINDQRWHDYVNNLNGPRFADVQNKGDGLGEIVFDTNGNWSLDWWEALFDFNNYE